MSAQEKMPPTKNKKIKSNPKDKIEVNGKVVTLAGFVKLLNKAVKLESYKKKLLTVANEVETDELLSMDDFFADINVEVSVIRGSRLKENISQTELAIRLNKVTGMKFDQGKVSKLENGGLNVSKKVAKGLAEIFDTDYRVFL